MIRTLSIPSSCGATTCAERPGTFCEWLRTRRFGTVPCCGLFDGADLKDKDGWVQRLQKCVAAESLVATRAKAGRRRKA